jgi:hypothetical protein
VNKNGIVSGFRVGPDYEQYDDTILAAVAALLLGLDAYLERFGTEQEKGQHVALVAEYKKLANSCDSESIAPG